MRGKRKLNPLKAITPSVWPPAEAQDSLGKRIAAEHTVLRVLVGSTVHGLSVESSDRDEMAIVVEPPEEALSSRRFEHWNWRTQPEGVRSGVGDLDATAYALHKFAHLLVGGNPTAMLPLFVPEEACLEMTEIGQKLRQSAPMFASRQAGDRFSGYLHAQRLCLLGERQPRVHRPELVAAYGYDAKYAGHVLRLGYQGVEYLQTGRLTLPMAEPVRSHLIDVRQGKSSLKEIIAEAAELEKEIKKLRQSAPFPEKPDYEKVNRLIASLYLDHWRSKGLI